MINLDNLENSELENPSDDELNFPEDYPTEDLYSVFNRLYSHAMYLKRTKAET